MEFDSTITRPKTFNANEEKSYKQTKDLLLKNSELKTHYDLDKYNQEIEKVKKEHTKRSKRRDNIGTALPAFEEYLKLLETTTVVFGKIRDMKAVNTLIRIFFSNFTIAPITDGSFKGSSVSYNQNNPGMGS